ncbi:MAG: hypothetical protein KDE19_02430 [Caldilineaceae bacterium]|nr:hypothetical protein [Caldilineaceae bacterium]
MRNHHLPKTELLLNPDTDVAHYRQHVNALTQPGSRFLMQEWHMGGMTILCDDEEAS